MMPLSLQLAGLATSEIRGAAWGPRVIGLSALLSPWDLDVKPDTDTVRYRLSLHFSYLSFTQRLSYNYSQI
jgi:hypothetical protein